MLNQSSMRAPRADRVIKEINGWQFRRSTIPGNYNLTHAKTGQRSGKIAGMDAAVQFATEHKDGSPHCVVKIGSKIYPRISSK